MIPAGGRRVIEILSLLVAALCVVVAVINRLAEVHILGRVEVLLELAVVAMLVALWAVADDFRARQPR